MRINFGCGKKVLPGFFNIDAQRSPQAPRAPELIHALEFTGQGKLKSKIPLEDSIAKELQAMHVIEHFYLWQVPAVLAEWKRLLKPGGLLVLELPNLEAACKNFLKGLPDQMCMWSFYGDPGHKDPYMCHRWGYSPKTLEKILSENGFQQITFKKPQTHGKRENRDMRVEAVSCG